jgi:hypothetical protein
MDFAGQEAYYATHQLFLSDNAVYVLVYHPRRGLDECLRQVRYWLESVKTRAGLGEEGSASDSSTANNSSGGDQPPSKGKGVPVLVVASHQDEGFEVALGAEDLRRRYSPALELQFASVSSKTGHGIGGLRVQLAATAMALPHMGRVMIDQACFDWLAAAACGVVADWLLLCGYGVYFAAQPIAKSWVAAGEKLRSLRSQYPAPGMMQLCPLFVAVG